MDVVIATSMTLDTSSSTKEDTRMLLVHSVIGMVTLIVSVALLIWNGFRLGRGIQAASYRMVLVGLLDLQVLLGVITWVIHPQPSRWLLHPLFMLIAVALGHTMLKDRRSSRTQFLGYLLIFVLLILGISVPSHV
jgi:cytochrome bd-type quinol oxidase subunit 2